MAWEPLGGTITCPWECRKPETPGGSDSGNPPSEPLQKENEPGREDSGQEERGQVHEFHIFRGRVAVSVFLLGLLLIVEIAIP
jgi:hypothetical protein